MKKIITLLIAISLSLSIIPQSVIAAGEDIDYKKWNMLTGVGAIEQANPDSLAKRSVTRGDFAVWLITLFNMDDIEYTGEQLFYDVEESDYYYTAANIAKQKGYVEGDYYCPDENITYKEAYEMLLKAMGYGEFMNPDILGSVSALDIPTYAADGTINYHQLVEMFYAAVHEPIMKFNMSVSGGLELSKDDRQTILSQYYEIELVEGLVTGNSLTTLYSSSPAGKNKVMIDETLYEDTLDFGKEFLGCNVRAYIDCSNDDEKVIYMESDDRKNSMVEIMAEDIEDVNDRVTEIYYLEEGNIRGQKEKLNINLKVIFNGKAVTGYSKADFMPELGSVTLIDNNNDYVFDVAKIWSYETMMVDRVSGDKVIYNAFEWDGATKSVSLDDSDGDLTYEIWWEGETTGIERITVNSIVSVAQSKNGEYVRIELGMRTKKGVLKGRNKDEREITFDDVTYKTTAEFEKEYAKYELNSEYTIYLDGFGNVASMIRKSDEEFLYAYLYRAMYSDDEEMAIFKVFTEEADWVTYSVTDKIRYNGKNVNPIFFANSTDAKRPALVDGDGNTSRQIVKIVTDGKKLIEIRTAEENGDYGEFNKKSMTLTHRYHNSSFDSLYYFGIDTITFGIPKDDPDDLDSYRIGPALDWNTVYDITVYGYDKYGWMDVCQVAIDSAADTTELKDVLVIDFGEQLDADGDVVDTMICSTGIIDEYAIELADGFDPSTVNCGDIVTLTINRDGQIEAARVIYSYVNDGEKVYAPAVLHQGADTYFYGHFVEGDGENDRMIMNFGGTRTNQPIKTDLEDFYFRSYDFKKRKSVQVSPNDLAPGDYIVLKTNQSRIYSAITYKK